MAILKLDDVEYELKKRTFSSEASVEDEALALNEEGKIAYKVGAGHYKMMRIFKHLTRINDKKALTFKDDIAEMDPDHASALLLYMEGTPTETIEKQYAAVKTASKEQLDKINAVLKEFEEKQAQITEASE